MPCPVPHREPPSVTTGVPGRNTRVAKTGWEAWRSEWAGAPESQRGYERTEPKPQTGALLGASLLWGPEVVTVM